MILASHYNGLWLPTKQKWLVHNLGMKWQRFKILSIFSKILNRPGTLWTLCTDSKQSNLELEAMDKPLQISNSVTTGITA